MIVLDASAAVELVLNTEQGTLVAQRLSGDVTAHAPQLLPIEVAQVLRRLVATDAVTARRAALALDDLTDLGVELYDHDVLVTRVWQLRANLTAYDAAYVALAEALGAPLVTFDQGLARAPGNRAAIEVPGR